VTKKIVVFVLFILLYALYAWIAHVFGQKVKRDLMEDRTFWNSQIGIVLSIVPFCVFIYLLSGVFSIRLVALLFLGSQIGVLIFAIVWGFLGSTHSKWGPRGVWAGGEFGMKQGLALVLITVPTVLLVIVYPIAAGIAYFRLPDEELTQRILQYTLVAVIFSAYPAVLATSISSLVSKNVDDETRARLFAVQASQLIQTALFLALAFWAFGIGHSSTNPVVGMSLSLEPRILSLLFLFFVGTALLPYMIGVQRSKRWRAQLLGRQEQWLRKVMDVLQSPNALSYRAKLDHLQTELAEDASEFEQSDTMVLAARLIDQGQNDPPLNELAPLYKRARDLIEGFTQRIREIMQDLEIPKSNAAKVRAGGQWAAVLQSQRDEICADIKAIEARKPPIWVGVGVLATPVLSGVLTEVSKSLWQVFSVVTP
jgi:hypothetical protein